MDHRKVDLIEGEGVILCLLIGVVGDYYLPLPYRPDQVLDLHTPSLLLVRGVLRLGSRRLRKIFDRMHTEVMDDPTLHESTLERLSEALAENPPQEWVRRLHRKVGFGDLFYPGHRL